MTLPVRIEAKAWTDSRYATLALHLGLSAGDSEIALIRCAAIWRWQTEHYTDAEPTYSVHASVVIGALKSLRGAEALVAADLAELEPDGRLRIRGGRNDKGESRIDWFWRDRQTRSAAGHASESRRGSDGRFGAGAGARTGSTGGTDARSRKAAKPPESTDGPPTDHRRTTDGPPTTRPTATDSPDSGLRIEDLSLGVRAGARSVGTAPAPAQAPERPPVSVSPPPPRPAMAWDPDRQLGGLVALAIDALNDARTQADPAARRIPPTADGDAAARALMDHLRQISSAEREPTLRHAIAVMVSHLAAEGKPVDDIRLGMLAGPNSWPRWRDGKVHTGGKRDGPRRQPSASRGQAPAIVTDRPDGAIPL